MNAIVAADLWFENLMFGIRSPLVVSVFKTVTLLGEAVFVLVLSALACIVLFRTPTLRAYAFGLATAVLGTGVTTYILKYLVDRARPDGFIQSAVEASSSFPSWHAAGSLALYGFAAYLLSRRFPAQAPLIIGGATLLIIVIGASRLYLGVHYPSDIVAGYAVGGVWLLIGAALTRRLQAAAPAEPHATDE